MSRVLHFIYGLALIYLAIDTFFLNIFPKESLPYTLTILGIIILLSPPMTSKPIVSGIPRYGPRYSGISVSHSPHNIRVFKWITGLGITFMGVIGLPFSSSFSSNFYVSDYLYGSDWIFSLVLLIFGSFQIYFSTKRGSINF